MDTNAAREELRRALTFINAAPVTGLEWVSRDAGIPLDKVKRFLGDDMTEPDDGALQDVEVKFLLDWYHFAGPT